MAPDRIITDPIVSPENTAFTPSSRPPIEHLPLASSTFLLPSERDPLVGPPKPNKPFYRARPLWLVPFALTISITRGMTLASRVEVFTELSCRQFHDNDNEPSTLEVRPTYTSIYPEVDASVDFTPLYLPSISIPARPFAEREGDGESEGDDPRIIPGRMCVSNPVVQAGAAKLQTIITATMGTLSALTTGWWGHFGERHGRTRVLAISTFGLFLTDLIFILVSTPGNPLATHSHKLLILAPIIEGSLGGWSSLTSATTAYIADCTSPGSRATVFARFTGVMFVGLALGPIIGAWLIRNPIPFLKVGQADHPLESVNSVFWVAICGSFLNFLLMLSVFPESLTASHRAMNRKGKNRAIEGDEIGTSDKHNHTWVVIRILKGFISPLTEFLPTGVPVTRSNGHKDWSLTFLALSLFIYSLASGLIQLKYLYAEHIYGWNAEQLSYYISFLGAGRALHLLIILPFLLTAFKPVQAAVRSVPVQPRANGLKAKPQPTRSYLFSEIRFDLLVVRCSMFVDFCSHALVVLSPLPTNHAASARWSQFVFAGVTSLTCAGAGVTPVAQSLALCTLQGRKMAEKEEVVGGSERAHSTPESGKLFGAISTLQAVGQAIVGPIVFGMIYSGTVASFPKAIFVAAAILVVVAIILTMFIKPNIKNAPKKRKPVAVPRHIAELERRGRSRAKKDLRGGSASASYGAMRYDSSISSWEPEAGPSGHM